MTAETYPIILLLPVLYFVAAFISRKIFSCYVGAVLPFERLLTNSESSNFYVSYSAKGTYKNREFKVLQLYMGMGGAPVYLSLYVKPLNIPKRMAPLDYPKINGFIWKGAYWGKDISWHNAFIVDDAIAQKMLDEAIKACELVESGNYDL